MRWLITLPRLRLPGMHTCAPRILSTVAELKKCCKALNEGKENC